MSKDAFEAEMTSMMPVRTLATSQRSGHEVFIPFSQKCVGIGMCFNAPVLTDLDAIFNSALCPC